ncbi:MAG TPA: 6-carboxytetrahydropterin synthase [Bryobacteraceae bacterium]|jgi:6-pyruvoyltetrahydropterin/6-carboxytetrahydropterin synthase|nr:6-carboxytetrahydropterin synthase [Bryobacteraceae bacterium]
MVRLTRGYRFCASHRLHIDSLSDAENLSLYGKCNNPYGHGHNYILEVSVAGPVDSKSGQVAHIATLDDLVRSELVDKLDHNDLNAGFPALRAKVPTTENLAREARRILAEAWPAAFPQGQPRLAGIRILETKRNSVELSTVS